MHQRGAATPQQRGQRGVRAVCGYAPVRALTDVQRVKYPHHPAALCAAEPVVELRQARGCLRHALPRPAAHLGAPRGFPAPRRARLRPDRHQAQRQSAAHGRAQRVARRRREALPRPAHLLEKAPPHLVLLLLRPPPEHLQSAKSEGVADGRRQHVTVQCRYKVAWDVSLGFKTPRTHTMNRADDLYSSIRSVDSIGTRSLAGGSAPHMSGVGIFFQQESDGKVYVKTIVSGGSAERDGRVRVGDVMCGVDGRDVIGEPVSVLRSLLLGHEGSNVVLTFARAVEPGAADPEADGGTVIAKFDVELPRGSPEYFARVDATRRYEAEMQDLRYQLKTTLGEEKEVAEEVERVKRVLQLERGASARREKVRVPLHANPLRPTVFGARHALCAAPFQLSSRSVSRVRQEMEEIRSNHMREVASLTEACRRAETARREAMGRLEPVRSRADDMTGACAPRCRLPLCVTRFC